MALSAADRRRLAAQGHHLQAKVVLAEQDVSDNVATQVDAILARQPLVKVRVNTRDREICAAIVSQLAERVTCEVVQRVGRVALLYREPAPADSQ